MVNSELVYNNEVVHAISPRTASRSNTEMFSEDLMIDSSAADGKQCEPFDKKGDYRPSSKEKKGSSDDGIGKKRDTSIKKKDVERLQRIHLKRAKVGGNPDLSPGKKQESRYPSVTNSPPDECAEVPKVKQTKKSSEEVVTSTRFKKKTKELEKEVKEVKEMKKEPPKKAPSKPKAVTAFGTTFHKNEEELPPMPKRRPSSSTYRFGRTKRSKSKEGILEEAGDEARKDSSQSQLRPSTRHSNVKMSLSKNKLTEMVEESNKDKTKTKGVFESSTGKRARSPYHTSSKIDTKKPSSKGRIEGDPKNNGGKQDEKGEVGKDLSFFEKIQQNVRAYFTPKSPDISKFEEEEKKKIQEGDNPPNDESIMIWKDEMIKGGVKEDFMKGDQNFFTCNERERKSFLERGYRTILKAYYPGGKTSKGTGYGPGGNLTFSIGAVVNTYYPSIEHDCKRLNCINRRYESTEKPRTGSFHRSKTFEKNGLAPSPPNSSTSISLILEPDEQVQNVASAYGMASAFAQIQEFHQEISPREERKLVNNARGTTCEILQEDCLTPIVTCLPGESVQEWTKRISSCLPAGNCSSRPKRFRYRARRNMRHCPTTNAIRSCQSTTAPHLDIHIRIMKRRSKSEDNIITSEAQIHLMNYHKDIPVQEETVSKTKEPDLTMKKPEKPLFIPRQTNWFVYSVTETTRVSENKSIQTPRRHTTSGIESTSGNASSTLKRLESDITNRGGHTNEGSTGAFKTRPVVKVTRDKTPELATQKALDNSPSVTLKDIISLSRRIFQEKGERGNNGQSCSLTRNKCEDKVRSELPTDKECKSKGNLTLSHYLEKLMEEKRNYLNLQKTKNFRRAQKANFIADSFNFFNLLNQEFLTMKSSDPRIEELRNAIAGEREPGMEEYLDMYKKVIRKSFTEPEQNLMDKAKLDLERYTDMYYDLMKHICLEEEGKGKNKQFNDLPRPHRSQNEKINYYEIFKQERRNRKPGVAYDVCLDRIKFKPEKSHFAADIEQSKRIRDLSIGKSKYSTRRSVAPHSNTKNQQSTNRKSRADTDNPVVELLSPHKPKVEEKAAVKEKVEVKESDAACQGKVLLTISVCDDGLIIKQVKGGAPQSSAKAESCAGEKSNNEDNMISEGRLKENRYEALRYSISEINQSTSIATSSENVEKTQSEQVIKIESDTTIYPKSSIDEDNDSSESPIENSMLKFKTFRKLLNEGLKYFTMFHESKEIDEHNCPKISKGSKLSEDYVKQGSRNNPTAGNKEGNQSESQTASEDQKKTPKRDSKLKTRETYSPPRSKTYNVHEEKVKKLLKNNSSRTRFGSFSRTASPSKINKKESFRESMKTKKEPTLWWRNEKSVPNTTLNSNSRKVYPVTIRKPEGSPLHHKRTPTASKPTAQANSSSHYPLKGDKKTDKKRIKGSEVEDTETAEEVETPESNSSYSTPPGSYFEWRLGMKSLKELLYDTPPKMLNPGGLAEGKLICSNEEKEERELQKMDYSLGDEKNDLETQTSSTNSGNPRSVLRLGFNNPLKTEWDQLVEASSQKDYQRVTEVLNQFMGNISEAWKAAVCLKDLIQPKITKTNNTLEEIDKSVSEKDSADNQDEREIRKNRTINSFRNFLRIVTVIFEEDPGEEVVRTELFLLMKELLQSFAADVPVTCTELKELLNYNGKTRFADEIAEMPNEVKEMIVKELISNNNTKTEEEYQPSFFVEAIKNVGKTLKEMYFTEKSEDSNAREDNTERKQPKKIYYKLPKNKSHVGPKGSSLIKSNLQSLAEKIKHMHKEDKMETSTEELREEKSILKRRSSLVTQSSVYFDAADSIQFVREPASKYRVGFCEPEHTRGNVELTSVDESYFALNAKTFAKYRDLIYDKIINFLRSDNPNNFNYGMALLGRMMERDSRSTVKPEEKTKSEMEKYNHLLEKLMETCQVIESEIKNQFVRCYQSEDVLDEKEAELMKTCEYLKEYVEKMKTLVQEIKSPGRHEGSVGRIEALEKSRETNMERQLIASNDAQIDGSVLRQRYFIDNAMDFINSIGNMGLEKLSKNLLPNWLARNQIENQGFDDSQRRETSELLLESNKAIVKSLRKKIERRQKKIEDMIDQAAREGVKREMSLSDEKIMRKVKDLKKCYVLLEKMICDPTFLPPKWLKLEDVSSDHSVKDLNPKYRDESSVMALLEDLMEKAVADKDTLADAMDQKVLKYSQSLVSVSPKPERQCSQDQVSIESLTWVKINYAKVNFEGLQQPEIINVKNDEVGRENGVPLRPKTA